MKSRWMVPWYALCGLLVCAVANGEGSADKGQAKSVPCAACHGADGNSISNPEWPSLAGQHPEYIVKQLKGFKSGARSNPLMSPMAATLSDEDMADLAAYFAAQKPASKNEAEPGKVPLGQRLYRGGDMNTGVAACLACHGPAGHGNPAAAYPSIRGQYATYIAKQLRDYRSGVRKTDQAQNQMMRNVANAMSDEQIDAVASYVQGMR
jgi:cytochrome c553